MSIVRSLRWSVLCAVLLLVLSAFGAAAQTTDEPADVGRHDDRTASDDAARGRPPFQIPQGSPPKIVNKVLDLLDRSVPLNSETERSAWESEPFPTSQANRIGIRADIDVESGTIVCSTWWRFARDDEFQPGLPSTPATVPFIGDDPGSERPDLILVSSSNFSAVFGLQAKIVCVARPGPDFGQERPSPTLGTISDVKVLLRRE